MSASSGDTKLIKALDFGADDFINKPPSKEELCARLRVAERSLRQKRDLIHQADTDVLTGLRNRRSFFETAETIVARASLVSAIMFDIDHFKRINDDFGHDVGDQVLKMVATVVHSTGLTVGRLGGEEFAIILEGKDVLAAFQLADSLRVRISNSRLETEEMPISVTCSLGVSERQSQETADDLLKRADIALYRAKTSGRNRVCQGTNDSNTKKPPRSVIRHQDRSHAAPTTSDLPEQAHQLAAAIAVQ